MKIIPFIVIFTIISNSVFAQLTDEYYQTRILKLIAEKTRLKEENKILSNENISLEKKLEIKTKQVETLQTTIKDKNNEITQLEGLLKNTEGLLEKQKIKNKLEKAIQEKQILSYEILLAQNARDLKRLRETNKFMQEEANKQINLLLKELFDKTFKVTASLNDGIFIDRPDGRVTLNSTNSNKIKASKINKLYVEFSLGGNKINLTTASPPDYRYNLHFTNRKNEHILLIEEQSIVIKNGEVNNEIPLNYTKSIEKGKYKLILNYEKGSR